MRPDLRQSLAMTAQATAEACDPWWIIGSAAVTLHGAHVPDIKDVDVLMTATDAEQVLRHLGLRSCPPTSSTIFRSSVFGTWSAPPLPVEVMGDLSLATPAGWRPVRPDTRQAVTVDGHRLFVPSAGELIAMLRSFGRPKDLVRLRLLEA
jgi:hypothetical protein